MKIAEAVTPSLSVAPLGTLAIDPPDKIGRAYLSSASGIACVNGRMFVVSDELGELGVFGAPGTRGKLRSGLKQHEHKPDLESMVAIQTRQGERLLFAAPSGSRPFYDRALVQRVDDDGRPRGRARTLAMGNLYRTLSDGLPNGINIEGMALRAPTATTGAELLLMHRGRLAGDVNRVFRLDARMAIDAIARGRNIPTRAVLGHVDINLGTLNGVPLGISDAVALSDGRIAFTASAEGDGGDAPDGAILGSAVGVLDTALHVQALHALTGAARKVEGIVSAHDLDPAAPANQMLLVTDADDPSTASELLRVELP